MRPGMRMEWSRTFTDTEILRFADFSGDRGIHHVKPDAQGRLMAHGLLTATLPTKLGGDLNFIARTMDFEFLRPVYAGEKLACVGLIDEVSAQRKRLRVKFSFTVTNAKNKQVLKGSSSGVIYGCK